MLFELEEFFSCCLMVNPMLGIDTANKTARVYCPNCQTRTQRYKIRNDITHFSFIDIRKEWEDIIGVYHGCKKHQNRQLL